MSRILMLCAKYAVSSGRYYTDAFRRLGHEVYVVGPEQGNSIWGIQIDNRYIWNEPGIPAKWEPDLVITCDTNFNPIVNYDCPHIIVTVDNHVRRVGDKKAYPAKYSRYFLAHHDGPAMPVCDCYDAPCTWLPCAHDHVWFTPSKIPMSERTYDVALIGVPYPRRVALVEAMQKAGLSVYAGLGPLYAEYRDIYHNARISLCVSAAGDVAQRVFEGAAMGCLTLTDRCADFGRLGFNQCVHGLIVDNDDAFVGMAKAILESPNDLKHIADEGQEWARPHTWDARAKTILETMRIS